MKKTPISKLLLVYKLISLSREVHSLKEIFDIFENSFKRVEEFYKNSSVKSLYIHELKHFILIDKTGLCFCEHSESVVLFSDKGEIVIFKKSSFTQNLYKTIIQKYGQFNTKFIYEYFLVNQALYFYKTKEGTYLTKLIKENPTYTHT